MRVPFIQLKARDARFERAIRQALAAVVERGDFILGLETKKFEAAFAAYCGSRFAVGLNSGTDALFLSLKALGIGPGDEVIVPAFTFIATANAVSYTGARPVYVDIDEQTFTIDPAQTARAVTRRTRAIIPVHLFGQCADMRPLMRIARKHSLKVIEDACQAHGAAYYLKQRRSGAAPSYKAGAMGDVGCFSFYPTKNLGGFGDAGLVVTDNARICDTLKKLRDCGRVSRYEHAMVGYNSRLDTLQAAVLAVKLRYLDAWNRKRQRLAAMYDRLLADAEGVLAPRKASYSSHVYHIYAVRVRRREKLAAHLKARGIGAMIHYPIPLHLQPAYQDLGYRRGGFPVAEKVCGEVLSLPMHPFLTGSQVGFVCSEIKKSFLKR
ncbi:MAG: DegT/DnrJ/EryC1/StrS family aminotransferase [Candidatus Omnitrophica bacterium]|nr:DegT/DnrJ/EryC1/StrS family aminotransferase [Candidatus Omnitrophota bacterium]